MRTCQANQPDKQTEIENVQVNWTHIILQKEVEYEKETLTKFFLYLILRESIVDITS